MDLKQQAAMEAATLIKDNMVIGLGAGATMAYMVQYLQEHPKSVQVYSSSAGTRELLMQKGFTINDIAHTAYLDIYFDGCDQFNKDLNALKSGGGIHTMEKLFASMAKEFVLVGDESKYSETLSTKFPVVLEVLPQARSYVTAKLETLYNVLAMSYRQTVAGNFTLTENGNLLLDVWFTALPALIELNTQLRIITGVVETSLFYNLATKAITAGIDGIKIFTKA
jgi:ribose 5-phosphate isomerase A